jgi:hypothetical protein
MHRTVFRFASVFAVAVLAVAAGGCWGPGQFDVTGQVKYNGTPLASPDGVIVFVGPNGKQVSAAIGLDGTYRAAGVAAGLNRIAVYYPNPKAQGGKALRPRKGEAPPPPSATPPLFLTPARYAAVETSDLSVQVEEGTVCNLDLTGPRLP